ncbi:peptide chain release factor N(5)-glutamine methyltransferase [Mangrovimonas sp. DI 80]|uniref:peptide chain release factor N(5)-glutamine methyltransferase n=1 Tax=Mangrovimonas sp. DI 80 TaxID=1779330 RepID=UPI0009768894|nr:peptide chain release factor N(5)-glutamine methyltransferase [Mangrovimonas sp. DI 80]OMP29796.1 protein-(glutamine-N5) methyltransferase, release factor-specific [Mangrovimonas sp. DI 80]
MILKDIKTQFHQSLDAIYGVEEVDSFFGLLLDHYFKIKPITLVLEPEYEVTPEGASKMNQVLRRLKDQEPIQYILGEAEFFGLPFKVSPATLIPRPETEELVNWIIETSKNRSEPIRILDIGTGTGCIPISLGHYLPSAEIYTLDVSAQAIEVAKENAGINNVDVNFMEGDILQFENLAPEFLQLKFDVIVSNPPYVRELEKSEMKTNVLDYEPDLALFVPNDDPLRFYKVITKFAGKSLKNSGMLFFEINQYLGEEMRQLLIDNNFTDIELRQDIFGNNRMLKGIKL